MNETNDLIKLNLFGFGEWNLTSLDKDSPAPLITYGDLLSIITIIIKDFIIYLFPLLMEVSAGWSLYSSSMRNSFWL